MANRCRITSHLHSKHDGIHATQTIQAETSHTDANTEPIGAPKEWKCRKWWLKA